MLKRRAWDKLCSWKAEKNKKALCIIGARQIGKTTIVRQFAKENYECFAEINFITDPGAAAIFSGALDADTLITGMTAYLRRPLIPGRTLILLDEIQECPEARTAVKFLVEDGRFDYIETGSMLGVRYREVRSYPVGYEELYRMYPMDLTEFLWANGVQDGTISYLKDCFEGMEPVAESVHETMKKLFMSYMVVGGMPQVVSTYAETHDIGRVIENQNEILELYRLDISKYAQGGDKVRIRAIFDSIPSQLNEQNRRFVLKRIDENGRQNRYENSFEWLAEAGVALPCYNVTEPQPPLKLNEKHSLFKLFMGDTGLLCAACMENIQFDILQGRADVNLGSVLENVMAQEIRSNGFGLSYFSSKKYGELDFVIQRGMNADLIEIKSGNDYKKHNALDRALSVEQWRFGGAYVYCRGNTEMRGDIRYLPWYMIMFYRRPDIPSGLRYEVDLTSLELPGTDCV